MGLRVSGTLNLCSQGRLPLCKRLFKSRSSPGTGSLTNPSPGRLSHLPYYKLTEGYFPRGPIRRGIRRLQEDWKAAASTLHVPPIQSAEKETGIQSFDYTTLAACIHELKLSWVPAKVDQVVQSDAHTLCLRLRARQKATAPG
eukprot:jgi/Botrbrau1/22826/Bobra.0132s0149.1